MIKINNTTKIGEQKNNKNIYLHIQNKHNLKNSNNIKTNKIIDNNKSVFNSILSPFGKMLTRNEIGTTHREHLNLTRKLKRLRLVGYIPFTYKFYSSQRISKPKSLLFHKRTKSYIKKKTGKSHKSHKFNKKLNLNKKINNQKYTELWPKNPLS